MNSSAAHEILAQHLKKRGKSRNTPARYAILEAVLDTQGHFNAESLYYRLVTNDVKISRATVYNTLDILQECGLVSKYRFGDNTSRYERAFERPHHHHLVCLSCGDILEFVHDRLNKLQDEVCKEKEFVPQSSSLQIFGTCSRCTKKE